jgi:hypothetical protein
MLTSSHELAVGILYRNSRILDIKILFLKIYHTIAFTSKHKATILPTTSRKNSTAWK